MNGNACERTDYPTEAENWRNAKPNEQLHSTDGPHSTEKAEALCDGESWEEQEDKECGEAAHNGEQCIQISHRGEQGRRARLGRVGVTGRAGEHRLAGR